MKLRGRLPYLLCAGLLLVGGALAYRELWLARPTGQGPAGPTVPPELFAVPWTDRAVFLVGIGDSITAGLVAKSPAHTYFQRLITNPEDEYADMQGLCLSTVIPDLHSQNLAVSGSTSIAHLDMVKEQLEIQPPETLGMIVMTSGGNDLIHNYGRTPPREGAMYGATAEEARPGSWASGND